MSIIHNQKCFVVSKIFRAHHDSGADGTLIAEDCLIHIDAFNVLCVFDVDEARNNRWNIAMYFVLNDADSIVFRKITSSTGSFSMGRMVITGLFGLQREKITMKMDLLQYKKLVEASRSWP